MEKSRTKNAGINVSGALLAQGLDSVLGFINRTIFIYILGAEYLGINGLYTAILSVLSFAELGIGNAMAFSLYKPLADNDREKIKSLIQLFSRAYKIIAAVIALLGIAIIPFLRFIVGEVPDISENLIIIYILFLMNSSISYLYAYKSILLSADQKNYIVLLNQQKFRFAAVIVQTLVLFFSREYILYLITNIAIQIMTNIYISLRADKMYPYLKEKAVVQLDAQERKNIFSDIKSLFIYKLSGLVIDSTDNIFISVLINVATVGIYSNYVLIINVFKTFCNKVIEALMASVGNLLLEKNIRKKMNVFNEIFFLCAWMIGFFSVGLLIFINPFIKLWIGEEYILSDATVVVVCLMFYITNMHLPLYVYRTSGGVFQHGKFVPLIAAPINVVLDIVLGMKFGISGIFGATIITRIFTYELIDPILIYKYIFGKNAFQYFIKYAKQILYTIVLFFMLQKVATCILNGKLINMIITVIVVTALYNIVFVLVFWKTVEFQSLINRGKNALKKKKVKVG